MNGQRNGDAFGSASQDWDLLPREIAEMNEFRRSEKNAWAFIKVVDISRVTSFEIIMQTGYKPELFRGHAK